MVNRLLGAALAAVQRDASEQAALTDGPPPVLRRREQARLVVWLADRVAQHLTPAQAEEAERIVETARFLLDGGDGSAIHEDRARGFLEEQHRQRRHVGGRPSRETRALSVAQLAGEAAWRATHPDELRAPSRIAFVAAGMAARAVLESEGFVACTDHLLALAMELLRLELCGAISRKLPRADVEVRQLVYRGHDGDRARVWIARLGDGSWGVLVRNGRNRWTRGARDEVGAHVPDRWFEAATRAMLAATPIA